MKIELKELNEQSEKEFPYVPSLELKPITLLFGRNGNGKSTVIRELRSQGPAAPPVPMSGEWMARHAAGISEGLRTLTGHTLVESFGKVLVVDPQTGARMKPEDAGSGVRCALPLVADLHREEVGGSPRQPDPWTILEYPETRLHPAAQVELGDLFISAARGGGKYIVETHSEHLLLRLLRRIDETTRGKLPDKKHQLRPDDISINYVFRRDGDIIVLPLPVDSTGEFLVPWPEGFFDEAWKELY